MGKNNNNRQFNNTVTTQFEKSMNDESICTVAKCNKHIMWQE